MKQVLAAFPSKKHGLFLGTALVSCLLASQAYGQNEKLKKSELEALRAKALPTSEASTLRAMPRNESSGATRVVDNGRVQEIRLQINKSLILELPADARDILISNPKIANAVIRSMRRVFLIGNDVGSTNIFFFDEKSQQIAGINLVVERDLEGLNKTLQSMFPNSSMRAEGIGQNVVLKGTVNSAADAKTAEDVANRFLAQSAGGSGTSTGTGTTESGVVNALTILGKDQVQIRVVIAEMDRSAAKNLGINLSGSQTGTSYPFSGTPEAGASSTFATNPVGVAGTVASLAVPATQIFGNLNMTANIDALERTGLIKTLAEPNLSAISGEEASFLAGGQFPVIMPGSSGSPPSVTFKDYGIGLAFSPVVLSEGRISLRVKTEVSEIDTSLSATIGTPGGGPSTVIPAVKTRKAETVLELPSGGSMVMAGLLSDSTKASVQGLPGLRKLPILGQLFSSREFITNQTELVVMVTPYIVNPVARKDIALPTDGFVNASEPEAALLGRLNKVYGTTGSIAPHRMNGKPGFIFE